MDEPKTLGWAIDHPGLLIGALDAAWVSVGPAAAGLRIPELEPEAVGILGPADEAESVVDDIHVEGMIDSDGRESQFFRIRKLKESVPFDYR